MHLLKSINALKEELHYIHGSLKHTAQREQQHPILYCRKRLYKNIVVSCNAIGKAEQNTFITTKIGTNELAKISQCSTAHIKAEEELLKRHKNKLAKYLRNNEGIWLSNRWSIFIMVSHFVCYLAVIFWAFQKYRINSN